MAPASNPLAVLVLLCMCGAVPFVARAGDPDILTDFLVPPGINPSLIDGAFFTYNKLVSSNPADPNAFTVTKATAAEFPALMGQSVSYAALMFGPGTVNPPHIHPRASELLCVVQGPLFVGLVDAARNGTVYTQTLQTGDMFVFPKGMVHFQFNNGTGEARAFSAFGGASPGTISLPPTLFETRISDDVLEKSLHTDQATVDALKKDLVAPPAPVPAPAPAPPSSAARVLSRSALMLLCFAAAFFL